MERCYITELQIMFAYCRQEYYLACYAHFSELMSTFRLKKNCYVCIPVGTLLIHFAVLAAVCCLGQAEEEATCFRVFSPHQFWPITACLCIKSSCLPKSELNLAGDHRAEEANNHNPAVCLL